MKFLIQRVQQASVTLTETNETRSIGQGLLVYVGFSQDDEHKLDEHIAKSCNKLLQIKVFSDEGRMSKSLMDIGGEILLVSNFTLYGRSHKGTQVDWSHAASYAQAEQWYNTLVKHLQQSTVPIKTGEFGAMMEIQSIVDGPVNLVLEFS